MPLLAVWLKRAKRLRGLEHDVVQGLGEDAVVLRCLQRLSQSHHLRGWPGFAGRRRQRRPGLAGRWRLFRYYAQDLSIPKSASELRTRRTSILFGLRLSHEQAAFCGEHVCRMLRRVSLKSSGSCIGSLLNKDRNVLSFHVQFLHCKPFGETANP